MSGSIGEFRAHWVSLLAAALGLSLGAALNHYVTSIFAPHLIAEFGWAKSQFALVGSLPIMAVLFIPLAGRLTDKLGARKAAMIGYSFVPLAFLAFSLMQGNIVHFFAIYLALGCFGIFTTSIVFCRAVVERFDTARGLALSLMMSGSPLIGALAVPLVGAVIEAEGWRAAYRMLAVISATGGLVTLLLMGRAAPARERPAADRKLDWSEVRGLVRNRLFLLLICGMFLCNLPQVIVSSQLKLVLLESGVTTQVAVWLVSFYAISVIIGRFCSGIALDRVPAHIVAVFALGLPCFGYLVLASHFDALVLLMVAILLIGLAQGAEGDIGAYLVSRGFDLKNYSMILSLVTATIAGSSALGSLVLSYSIHQTDTFAAFLVISTAVTAFGALLFLAMGRHSPSHDRLGTAAGLEV